MKTSLRQEFYQQYHIHEEHAQQLQVFYPPGKQQLYSQHDGAKSCYMDTCVTKNIKRGLLTGETKEFQKNISTLTQRTNQSSALLLTAFLALFQQFHFQL
jgi:hypothetical protein